MVKVKRQEYIMIEIQTKDLEGESQECLANSFLAVGETGDPSVFLGAQKTGFESAQPASRAVQF